MKSLDDLTPEQREKIKKLCEGFFSNTPEHLAIEAAIAAHENLYGKGQSVPNGVLSLKTSRSLPDTR